jgi:homoserine kinase
MDDLTTGPVRVRVPASSANLGPGYDALGLALGLHDLVTAEVVDGPAGSVRLEVVGEGADTVSLDESHLVHRCVVRGLRHLGADVPALSLHCRNAVPHGRGLGSSSAAIVAGLGVARALVPDGAERWDDLALFRLAAEIEGHPDNVAPATFGGLTVSWRSGTAYDSVRLEVAAGPAFVVLVPPEPLATSVARGLLPEHVPHRDAAHAAGRAALLVACLSQGPDRVPDWRSRLLAATEDRLHQDSRAPAMPGSARLIAELRSRGIAAVVSGAGPTVLAVCEPAEVDEIVAAVPDGWWARRLDVDVTGLAVEG